MKYEELFTGLEERISQDYETVMASCLCRRSAIDTFISGLSAPGSRYSLMYLYAFMPTADLVSYRPDEIYSYVLAAQKAFETVPYADKIPPELFLAYVLHYRVNNETIDGCRGLFQEELFPRIQGKSMKDAVLEVNYWCYEKATYTPTDSRTVSPLAMTRIGKGRCGEESTLTVTALRSVGIPARQVYVPRWAHCDDNHAWVEAWADGSWYYLGACEPEPALNKGWFTAAASKSMLVHTKAFSGYLEEDGTRRESPLFELVNCTPGYAETKKICVRLTDGGVPQAGIPVRFELVNYSELFPIYTAVTDGNGLAEFITGLGDLHISAAKDGRLVSARFDVRSGSFCELDWKDALCPAQTLDILEESFDLVPPCERVNESVPVSADMLELHNARLRECEAIRARFEASFFRPGEGDTSEASRYLALSKGNQQELRSFLENPEFCDEDKRSVLSTLREKDYADITAETLNDTLRQALVYRERYRNPETFRLYVLAPRISDEMTAPVRGRIRTYFEEHGPVLSDAEAVWEYVKNTIQIRDEYGCENISADNFGILSCHMCGRHNLYPFYVSVCRALGFAARLNPALLTPEYITEQEDGTAVFHTAGVTRSETELRTELKSGAEPASGLKSTDATNTSVGTEPNSVSKMAEENGGRTVDIVLINTSGHPLRYETQFTIGRFNGECFETLQYPERVLNERDTFSLPEGCCRIITCTRQIDGTASVKLYTFHTKYVKEISITAAPDKTAEKLKSVPVSDTVLHNNQEPSGLYQECGRSPAAVIFAEPGREPTEHLFQEMLELKADYNRADFPVILIVRPDADRENQTLQRVLSELNRAALFTAADPDYEYRLHSAMGVGDERLPFALALSAGRRGLFAFAGYNIGTAKTLLSILKSEAAGSVPTLGQNTDSGRKAAESIPAQIGG